MHKYYNQVFSFTYYYLGSWVHYPKEIKHLPSRIGRDNKSNSTDKLFNARSTFHKIGEERIMAHDANRDQTKVLVAFSTGCFLQISWLHTTLKIDLKMS